MDFTSDLPWLWISARSLGLLAWLAASATVDMGILLARRAASDAPRVHRLHGSLVVLTLVLTLGHIAALLPDDYAQLSLWDVVIPGLYGPNRLYAAAGSLAFLIVTTVAISALLRKKLRPATWRKIHWLAYAVWPLATAHYIMMGTDAMAFWSLVMIALVAITLMYAMLKTPQVVAQPAAAVMATALPVSLVRHETASAITLFLDTRAAPEYWKYRAGQFITVQVPTSQGLLQRCYSISDYQPEVHQLAITVQQRGAASAALCLDTAVGTKLNCLPPRGHLGDQLDGTPVLAIAAGSGITAIRAIAQACIRSATPIRILHIAKNASEQIFAGDLALLQQQHPQLVSVLNWHTELQGRPETWQLAQQIQSAQAKFAPQSMQVVICGGSEFVAQVRTLAEALHVDQVSFEAFMSLASSPSTPRLHDAHLGASAAVAEGTTMVLPSTVVATVDVAGQTHEVAWPAGQTLTDTLAQSGVPAPSFCRSGFCGECKCQLVRGEVRSTPAPALSAQEQAAGYILGCQSQPASDDVHVRYSS